MDSISKHVFKIIDLIFGEIAITQYRQNEGQGNITFPSGYVLDMEDLLRLDQIFPVDSIGQGYGDRIVVIFKTVNDKRVSKEMKLVDFINQDFERETSKEILLAIAYIAANYTEAQAIWLNPRLEHIQKIKRRVTENGRIQATAFRWGTMGTHWAMAT